MASNRYSLIFCIVLLGCSLTFGYPERFVSEECESLCGDRGFCQTQNGQPTCLCFPEWEGQRCDTPRRHLPEQRSFNLNSRSIQTRFYECSLVPNLCANGVCQFINNTFSCECPFTFIGTRCEIPSPCIGFCLNGGYCTLNDTISSCNCTDTGFQGTRCDVPLPPTTTLAPNTTTNPLCAAFEPFCNGAKCDMQNGRPVCLCPPGSILPFCTAPTTIKTDPPGVPTAAPTPFPTPAQTAAPTGFPTAPPTGFPTAAPTGFPTAAPTGFPTAGPTGFPTAAPTGFPTAGPTAGPPVGVNCASNPCRNSRPCYNNGNSYFCFCGNSYTGYNCETMIGK